MKLWRIAKFLEEIPGKLPFAQHPYRHIIPVQQYSQRDMRIYLPWLVAWYVVGATAVTWNNLVAGVVYFILGPVAYVTYLYLACTKCPYYGKRCYMAGGQCAQRFFKARSGDYTLGEDLVIPLLWLGVSIYPPVILFIYKSWWALVLFLVLALSWQIFHKQRICAKCLNVKCALNPRFVGRSGRP